MDEDITALIEAGQLRSAFELALARYQAKVFRLAFTVLRNEALAEEAAQETFIRIWNALSRFDPRKSALSTWIYAITRNTAISERRKAPPEPAPVEAAESGGGQAHPYVARLAVEAVLARLPENYRRVLALFYMEQRSYAEVSDMLGLPLGTVKTQLHRAKSAAAVLLREGTAPVNADEDERGARWTADAFRI